MCKLYKIGLCEEKIRQVREESFNGGMGVCVSNIDILWSLLLCMKGFFFPTLVCEALVCEADDKLM